MKHWPLGQTPTELGCYLYINHAQRSDQTKEPQLCYIILPDDTTVPVIHGLRVNTRLNNASKWKLRIDYPEILKYFEFWGPITIT